MQIPPSNALAQYDVNIAGVQSGLRWELYDSVSYPTGGQTQLDFFQIPQGQSSKTLADTNMNAAGQLPNPQRFLVTDIQLNFLAGAALSAAAGVSTIANDAQIFWQGKAWLEFYIGSAYYVQQGPLLRFPPRNGLLVQGNIPSTDMMTYAVAGGAPYLMGPPLLLTPNQNFKVSLKWPAALAITTASTVTCTLGGFLYRQALQ
ncbi:MAG: hypothetical protein ACYDHF_07955 [Candidatus Cryosericum sp.]